MKWQRIEVSATGLYLGSGANILMDRVTSWRTINLRSKDSHPDSGCSLVFEA